MPKAKVKPVEELKEAFYDVEFSKPADRLVESIKQYYERVEGVTPSKNLLIEEATKIIERRVR